jgi:hypothetical protein
MFTFFNRYEYIRLQLVVNAWQKRLLRATGYISADGARLRQRGDHRGKVREQR